MSKTRKPAAAAKTAPSKKQRIAKVRQDASKITHSESGFQNMIAVLQDRTEDVEVRLAALQTLQAATFSVEQFAPHFGDYVAALRAVADDPELEIRQRVLGILAREKDGFAQEKLIAGLRDPAAALLSPEKALQLLSYDIHTDVYPIARSIATQSPNVLARREALRLLANDPAAASLFEKILRNKEEEPEIRQMCASALHSLKPAKLQSVARAIVLDAAEPDAIKATCLTALSQFGDNAAIAADKALLKGIDHLASNAPGYLKHGARTLLNRYHS